MKFETTFEELARLFGAIAKADNRIETLKQSREAYNKASEEYAKNDYDAFYALRMSEAYDKAVKARKAVMKSFSDLLDLLGIDRDSVGGEEGYIVELSKRIHEPASFMVAVKEQAVRLTKYVIG